MAGKVQKAHHEAGGGSFVLGSILAGLDLQDVVSQIKKGTQYVVQIPQEYRKGLSSGRYTFLQNKNTGKTWATICEKLPNGQTKIVSNCPIKAEDFFKAGQFHNLLNSLSTLMIQQQLSSMSKRLEEVREMVERIEKGQRTDRVGKIIAGKDQICSALRAKDAEMRKYEIATGRNSLYEGRDQIGQALRSMVVDFEPLHQWRLISGLEALFIRGEDHYDKQDNRYQLMANYCETYILATGLLAESYIMCGEEESAEAVFGSCEDFFRSMNFSKVRTILTIHPTLSERDLFYYDLPGRISRNRKACLSAEANVVVDGETLLVAHDYAQGNAAYTTLLEQPPGQAYLEEDVLRGAFAGLNKDDHSLDDNLIHGVKTAGNVAGKIASLAIPFVGYCIGKKLEGNGKRR